MSESDQDEERWVRYICKNGKYKGRPYWSRSDCGVVRWDPPPPSDDEDDGNNDEHLLLESDSDAEDEKLPGLKGVAKLKAAAEQSKRKAQGFLVAPPTNARKVGEDGAIAESSEKVPKPSVLTAIEASFDPAALPLKDKMVDGVVVQKGLKNTLLDLGLNIRRPEEPTKNLLLNDLKLYAREQLNDWHKREGTLFVDSNFITK